MEGIGAGVRRACFVHWPVDADALAHALPPALAAATRDGTGWISVVGQRTRAALGPLPRFEFSQVTLRTYVRPADGPNGDGSREGSPRGDAVGVHFLRLYADSRVASTVARLLFEVPYGHAAVTHRPGRGDLHVELTTRAGRLFAADVEPAGTPGVPEPASTVAWLTERYRYYLPDGREGVVGHVPWSLYEARGTVTTDGLFATMGLPEPAGDPLVRYAPGVDVRLVERP